MNIIFDVEHTVQVLENIVHKAIRMAEQNTQILIQSWIELIDPDKNQHSLNFSVDYVGESLSNCDQSILDANSFDIND